MGGILSGVYQMGTGVSGIFGGSPERRAADEERDSKLAAAQVGEVEAKQQGNFEAGRLRMQGSQMIAKQRTAAANSGVDSTTGTPADVMRDTRLMSELDARMAENNAARKVRGYREQKRQAESEYKRRIDEQTQAAVGSIIGGAGKVVGGGLGG